MVFSNKDVNFYPCITMTTVMTLIPTTSLTVTKEIMKVESPGQLKNIKVTRGDGFIYSLSGYSRSITIIQ